jgi:uncharacterized protein YdaU (DUF1376 family)
MIMHFYIRHIGDYARDTANLSALEVGIYDLFLDFYYSKEEPLPLNRIELKTLARTRNASSLRAMDKVLSVYFKKTERGYTHERVEEELDKARSKSDKAKAAAAARWDAEKSDANASKKRTKKDAGAHANASGDGMRSHRSSNASHKPVVNLKPKPIGEGKPPQPTPRTRVYTAKAKKKSAAAASPDGPDVLDVARQRTEVEALVAHLRDEGVSDASSVHASVRQWAGDPAMREVIDEGIARMRTRHNVRHPMALLAKIVPDVIDERENPPPATVLASVRNVPIANGHASFDERSQDRKRAANFLTGHHRRNGSTGEVIDIDASNVREISDDKPHNS